MPRSDTVHRLRPTIALVIALSIAACSISPEPTSTRPRPGPTAADVQPVGGTPIPRRTDDRPAVVARPAADRPDRCRDGGPARRARSTPSSRAASRT